MNKPSLQQVRTVVVETAVAVGLELAFVELAQRFARGRTRPQPDGTADKRHLTGRTAAAILVELKEAGVAESRWQHSRMRAAVDQAAARQSLARGRGAHAHVPQQRTAGKTSRTHGSHAAAS